MEDGEISFAKAIGSKSASGEEAFDTETLFQLGSVTKMLTAIGLLQQVETQGLDLRMRVPEILPESEFEKDESWNDNLVLVDLLSHRTGIYDWLGEPGNASDAYLETWFTEVFFPNLWLMNPPGLFWNYSNPNFSLAGLLMEKLDPEGRSYSNLMKEEVFGALGMERSYVRKDDAKADGNFSESVGYTVDAQGNANFGPVPMKDLQDMAQGRPAGSGTWSTPTQMMEVARFILEADESVLREEYREQFLAKQVHITSSYYDLGMGYGLGIMSMDGIVDGDTYYPESILTHDGATGSFSATFWVLPEKNAAFCILSNGYGSHFPVSVLEILRILMEGDDDGTADLPTWPIDLDTLDLHDANYSDSYNLGSIVVRRAGDDLTISMPKLDDLGYVVEPNLTMVGDRLFYVSIDDVYYALRFIGEEGESTQYVVNRAFVGTRALVQDVPKASLSPQAERTRIDAVLSKARSPLHPLILGLPQNR
jgi:CubicO group peptidase (beta-lactamase class C family)